MFSVNTATFANLEFKTMPAPKKDTYRQGVT